MNIEASIGAGTFFLIGLGAFTIVYFIINMTGGGKKKPTKKSTTKKWWETLL
jgi:hypothetical protein